MSTLADGPVAARSKQKPRILCVDDEPQVLEGLELHLRRSYEVDKATSGAEALQRIEQAPGYAIIMSDMRMPGMDGATFLARCCVVAPDAVRLLLTGQADLEAAIHAINEGRIFRFMSKPCPPATLLATVAAALEQHRLITAERELLEQTLHGSVKALTDVLALVSPPAFGRATRIRELVGLIADRLDIKERWQVDVAAMLSQIGSVALPPALAERVYSGAPLDPEETQLVSRLPSIAEELLGGIPRLDEVRDIMRGCARAYRSDPAARLNPKRNVVATGTQLLRLAVDFDALESAGSSSNEAVDTLRSRGGGYDQDMLEALAAIRGGSGASQVREVSVHQLRAGMVLAEDVRTKSGALLVARGYEVTERFLERLGNFSQESVNKATWRVRTPNR